MPVEPPVASPQGLGEALALMAATEHRPVAGGTDLLVQLTGEIGEPPARVIDLWAIDDLRGISLIDRALEVGALTTYTELRASSEVREHLPGLVEAAATIGAAQIQNRGTIGGNVANASPAGDTLPLLLAADAEIIAVSARGERSVPASAFWVAYRRTALAPDELVARIRFPLPAGRQLRFRKVGTRRAQAISKVVMAAAWQPDADGRWRDVRIAFGSMAATPVRVHATEAAIEGEQPTQAAAERAVAILADELQPIDDVRSTADYRRAVAGRILRRLLRDEGGW